MSIHEVMIRNLFLTLESFAEFPATAVGVKKKKKSLHSLTRVAPDNRTAFDYLLAEQRDVCAVANMTCHTYINTSGKVESQLDKITGQAIWLTKVTPSMGLSLICFI